MAVSERYISSGSACSWDFAVLYDGLESGEMVSMVLQEGLLGHRTIAIGASPRSGLSCFSGFAYENTTMPILVYLWAEKEECERERNGVR